MEMACAFNSLVSHVILKPWPKSFSEDFSCKNSVNIFLPHFKECVAWVKSYKWHFSVVFAGKQKTPLNSKLFTDMTETR